MNTGASNPPAYTPLHWPSVWRKPFCPACYRHKRPMRCSSCKPCAAPKFRPATWRNRGTRWRDQPPLPRDFCPAAATDSAHH